MDVVNLSSLIDVSDVVTKKIINNWNTVIVDLNNNHVRDVKTITPVMAEKYKYDLEGLLQYLGIERKFIYPHIRVNGYFSSNGYNGEITDIKIVDSKVLHHYYELFTK